jgi:hypothetical protein
MTDPRISASGPSPQPGGPPDAAPPPGPGVLQVEFAPTLDDALAFFQYDLKLSPRARRQAGIPAWVMLVFVVMALTVGLLTRLMVPHMRSFDLFDGLMLAVVVWLLFRVFFSHRLAVARSLRAVRRNPRFFLPSTVTVSPEGLSVSDSSGASITRWHAVVWVVAHGEHAFLYKTERLATIVPQWAFADRRQFEEFVDAARHYHAEARRFVRSEGPT